MKKAIYQVTASERDEILSLYERQNGLNELAKILTTDNTEMYERLVKDLGDTSTKAHEWWDTLSRKYEWESNENCHWEIDFDTCEIFLVTPE